MSEQASQPVPPVERLVDAPVIYFDAIPSFGTRGGVLNAVLAVHIGELTSPTEGNDHVVAVANLRFTLATANQLRGMLDKLLLAAAPTGQAN